MYARIKNGVVAKYPVYPDDVMIENPQISFPRLPWGKETLSSLGLVEVKRTHPEKFDPDTHYPVEIEPENKNGKWEQRWQILPLPDNDVPTGETQKQKIDRIRRQRREAYKAASDQLFFEAQRGEIPHDKWLEKVAEIKAAHPYE